MRIDDDLSEALVLAELGQRLAQARIFQRMTQAQLAAAAGVSKRTVERLEDGESGQLATLIRCLRALGRLGALDRLLPEAQPSPIALLERKGATPVRVKPRSAAPQVKPWTWGDDA